VCTGTPAHYEQTIRGRVSGHGGGQGECVRQGAASVTGTPVHYEQLVRGRRVGPRARPRRQHRQRPPIHTLVVVVAAEHAQQQLVREHCHGAQPVGPRAPAPRRLLGWDEILVSQGHHALRVRPHRGGGGGGGGGRERRCVLSMEKMRHPSPQLQKALERLDPTDRALLAQAGRGAGVGTAVEDAGMV